MEQVISNQPLNPVQLHLLKMLSFTKTEKNLQDLKRILREYYIQQVEKEADQYTAEGKLGEHLPDEHLRTPYR
ncbi:MAG: hypothetical protein LBE56_01630 [Tannerella sp.]|jgi:hypothetical protein|nr:hypothetical protein [Tannerella sp.]